MMKKSAEKIIRILQAHESEIKEKYRVRQIGLFGSYLRGEQKKGSDVDILVDFYPDSGMDLITFVELEDFLSALLGMKVDLVMKSALKPRLGKHILKEVEFI